MSEYYAVAITPDDNRFIVERKTVFAGEKPEDHYDGTNSWIYFESFDVAEWLLIRLRRLPVFGLTLPKIKSLAELDGIINALRLLDHEIDQINRLSELRLKVGERE